MSNTLLSFLNDNLLQIQDTKYKIIYENYYNLLKENINICSFFLDNNRNEYFEEMPKIEFFNKMFILMRNIKKLLTSSPLNSILGNDIDFLPDHLGIN